MKKCVCIVAISIFSFVCIQEATSGALAKGCARIAIVAGRKLIEGFSVEVGKELATQVIDSFSEEEEQESAESQYRLGWQYDEQKSYAEAARWYLKAARRGHLGAQYNIADMYYSGEGVVQSYTEAFYWFKKAADQGDVDAIYYVGLMYDKGYGVQKSYAEAARWYLAAADQGDMYAQYNLGDMYFYGDGVQQSYSESFYWTEKSAFQGLMQAQNALGVMYDGGYGVTPSASVAVYWYRKAIRQGSEDAEANLIGLVTENVKRSLYRLGYYNGPIDGKLSPETRDAIRQYQYQNNLDADGRITESLLESLGIRF